MSDRARAAAAIVVLSALTACSGGGVNAGEEGGVAFIAFTGMLLAMIAVLYFFIGRQD